ncbi:MAG: GguC protein [Sphingobacteriaceae bacterium]|nr:MAG: GguC protein [Sphingobacteriaceae bacterium]
MANTHLVQLKNNATRAVALVSEPELILINNFSSVYDMALAAVDSGISLKSLIEQNLSANKLNYDEIYNGQSEWKLLPAFDNPENPMNCIVSGTGLTHKSSAMSRQVMHQDADAKPTDSLVMYQWGVEGGNPGDGKIGVQAEWFYKGTGYTLKAHGEPLEVPAFGNDGGEEPEVAALYVIDKTGQPHRVGFATGNEFSDHVMEKKNFLYLAPSKLRQCSIGPELVIDADFNDLPGKVSVSRGNETLWEGTPATGQSNMAHSLANLEYHHFKYEGHRMPLQAHVHYLGTNAFSYSIQLQLQDKDVMTVQWEGMGRALKNPIKINNEPEKMIVIKSI